MKPSQNFVPFVGTKNLNNQVYFGGHPTSTDLRSHHYIIILTKGGGNLHTTEIYSSVIIHHLIKALLI